MGKIDCYRKEVKMLRRVLNVKPNTEAYEINELLRQHELLWKETTKNMTPSEKAKLDMTIAEQIAKEYGEGKIK